MATDPVAGLWTTGGFGRMFNPTEPCIGGGLGRAKNLSMCGGAAGCSLVCGTMPPARTASLSRYEDPDEVKLTRLAQCRAPPSSTSPVGACPDDEAALPLGLPLGLGQTKTSSPTTAWISAVVIGCLVAILPASSRASRDAGGIGCDASRLTLLESKVILEPVCTTRSWRALTWMACGWTQ